MWQRYGIICHQGASSLPYIVPIVARDISEAREKCQAAGYSPVYRCLAYVKPVN